MKSTMFVVAIFFALLNAVAFAQDEKPKAPLNDVEQKFKNLLTNVTMAGRWYSVKDGQMGDEKQDKYTIVSVDKIKGDSWIIKTKMKYRDQEMTMPLPIEVKWAGDTAVIVVNNLAVPGGGTYSARVLFFQNTYAGSWTGGDHGGLLNGTITRNKE